MAAAVEVIDTLMDGEEVATIGDGIAEDADLTEDFANDLTEVDAAADELLEVTETDIDNLDLDEDFNAAEEDGTFDEAEESADVSEEEQDQLLTDEEAVEENNKSFRAKLQSLYKSMKNFITSPFGEACIKTLGIYFKFKFILDIVNSSLTEVNEIVNGSSSSDSSFTDDQQATADTLTKYITFLSSMYDITSSVGTSLKTASTFGTGDDSDTTSAAYLAGNMTTNNFKSLMSVTGDALEAANTLLLNISSALTTLGYSSDMDSDSFVKSIVYNPTLLVNSFDALDVDSIDTFKTAVTTYKSTCSSIIAETYTVQTEIDTVTAFFYISDGWDTTADSLETFVTNAQSSSLS